MIHSFPWRPFFPPPLSLSNAEPFYLRRSPGHGTVRVVLLLVVVVVATFLFSELCVFQQYDKDKSCRYHQDKQLFLLVGQCVTSRFGRNRQKRFDDFVDFYVFGHFDPLSDLKSQI